MDELLDELAAQPQPADLHAVFSRALPTFVIARLLGVPEEDSPFFIEKTRVTMSQQDPAVAQAAFVEMSEYLVKLALRKLTDPGDDLISRLAVNHHATGALTLDELVGIACLVLVAGHETTTNQIALNVLALLRDDQLRVQVAADDGAIISAFVVGLRPARLPGRPAGPARDGAGPALPVACAAHGMFATHADRLNADLPAFVKE